MRLERFFNAITTNPFGRELLGRSLGGLVIAFGLRPRLIVCESGSLFRALGGSLVSLYLYLKIMLFSLGLRESFAYERESSVFREKDSAPTDPVLF